MMQRYSPPFEFSPCSDLGNESEAEDPRLSFSRGRATGFDHDTFLAQQKALFHSHVVQLLDVAGRVAHIDTMYRVIDLVCHAVAVARGQGFSSTFPTSSPSMINSPQHQSVCEAPLDWRVNQPYAPPPPVSNPTGSEQQATKEKTHEVPDSVQLPSPPPSLPSAEGETTKASLASARRHTTRHKRSAFQKDDDARALLHRMRASIQHDVLWTPDDWLEIKPLDQGLTLKQFIADYWSEEVRLYRAAVPPKLWDVLRLGRDMEFVYQKCLQERPKFTWRQWLNQYCEPHGIKAQVANRNRRMWRIMSSYPLMQFSSIPLRELNKNVCAIGRCLATDSEACRFWSQTLNDFLQTLPDLEISAQPSRKRKRSAAEISAASVPQHASDGEQGSDFDSGYCSPDGECDMFDEEEEDVDNFLAY